MADPVETVAATTQTETKTDTVLSTSDQPIVEKGATILDTAGEAEKVALEAENKRILEADPTTLKPEEVEKRDVLVKEQEAAKIKTIEDAKVKGVPEKYEVKGADGKLVEIDPVAIETFKKVGLTNNQAQALVEYDSKRMAEAEKKSAEEFKKFLVESAKETMDALGSNAKTELAYVAKVKGHFSKETIDVLNSSGIGNVKSFIMDMAKLGRLFSEEKNVDTGRSSGAGKTDAEIMYPTMKQN